MRVGIFTVILDELPLEAALDRLATLGVQAVELGTGNYSTSRHAEPRELLADPARARALRAAVEQRGMVISALSQHGNPLHPDRDHAGRAHATWRRTLELAELLEVDTVTTFSGCPGDHDGALRPNWVTCAWPDDFRETLEWQWSERVIPYWQAEVEVAGRHGVRTAVEMHPGFVVYNNETLLRLREATGPGLGANFDPSHLFWQGVDPVTAIAELGRAGALFHVHAKDTWLDAANIARNGVLDTKPSADVAARSWTFRTIGYGQGEKAWRDIVSALQLAGYDGTISIEHEDRLASTEEGVRKAVELLRSIVLSDPRP